jgi:hypothetical protein
LVLRVVGRTLDVGPSQAFLLFTTLAQNRTETGLAGLDTGASKNNC